MMRRRCIRRKKSPPGHYADHGPLEYPGHGPEDTGATTPARPREADARLWPGVSRPGESLCEFGPADRNASVDDGSASGGAGTNRPDPAAARVPADRGPADPLGYCA